MIGNGEAWCEGDAQPSDTWEGKEYDNNTYVIVTYVYQTGMLKIYTTLPTLSRRPAPCID
jgi:hypothetical protein